MPGKLLDPDVCSVDDRKMLTQTDERSAERQDGEALVDRCDDKVVAKEAMNSHAKRWCNRTSMIGELFKLLLRNLRDQGSEP